MNYHWIGAGLERLAKAVRVWKKATRLRDSTLVACWNLLVWIGAAIEATDAGDIDALVLARVPDRPARSPAISVAVEGYLACVAYGDAGVQLLDVRNPAAPRVLSTLSQVGRVNDVALAGGFAYLAADGFMVMDVSNPESPRMVSVLESGGRYSRVLVSGDRAYVLGAWGRLEILDIADPYHPGRIGEYTDGIGIFAVAVHGVVAHLAQGFWFTTVDISDPSRPVVLGKLQLPRAIEDVALRGDLAYASSRGNPGAGSNGGWCVIDVSNPENPTLAGQFSLPDVWRIVIEGSHAYLAGYEDGISRYDLSDPLVPRFLDRCDTPGQAIDLTVSNGLALVADGYAGLQVLEVNGSTTPRGLTQPTSPGVAERVVVSEGKAFVAERYYQNGTDWGGEVFAGGGLRIFDVQDPFHPREVGHYVEAAGEFLSFYDVAVTGNLACVAAGFHGVTILDVANPEGPIKLPVPAGMQEAIAIAVSGGYAYVACRPAGQQPARMGVIDLGDPANPRVVGVLPITGGRWPTDIAVSGSIACLAMEDTALQIIDVADPTRPTVIAVVDGLIGIRSVAMAGAHAYASGNDLSVIDLQDPTQPRSVGRYPAFALDVQVMGQRAYLAIGNQGWLILDVSDPSTPRRTASVPTSSVATSIAGVNAHAVGVDWNGQLTSMHLANPGNPARLGTVRIEDAGSSVAVWRGFAYVSWLEDAEGERALSVIDVRNPVAPALIRRVTLNNGDWNQRLAAGGDHLYLVQEHTGLQILSLQDPTHPAPVALLPIAGEEFDLALVGDLALVMATLEDGPDYLHLINIADPTRPRLLASHPIHAASRGLSVDGHTAYVYGFRGGYEVIDFSDPAHPRTLPWWSSWSFPAGVVLGSDRIGYRPSEHGVEVWDVQDSNHPRRLGGNTSFSAAGIAVDDRHLYVITRDREFLVLDRFQPTRLAVDVGSAPNEVTLQVTGLAGLRVRVQRSGDLRTWEDVGALTLSDGSTPIMDGSADGPSGRRFYRTTSP